MSILKQYKIDKIDLSDDQVIYIKENPDGIEISYSQSYDAVWIPKRDVNKVIQHLQRIAYEQWGF